ncbi:MAG: hypothetical protein LC798_07105, partial [Chloroflexi bacterium]|nr:hypothetical protein [Chloroflexota bacterium]
MIVDERPFLGGGVTVHTSTTRPSSPFVGQKIYETDTSRELVWGGTDWRNAAIRIDTGGVLAGPTPSASTEREMRPFWQGGLSVALTSLGGDVTITFPTPFPTGVLAAVVTAGNPGIGFYVPAVGAVTLANMSVRARNDTGAAIVSTTLDFHWMALGY